MWRTGKNQQGFRGFNSRIVLKCTAVTFFCHIFGFIFFFFDFYMEKHSLKVVLWKNELISYLTTCQGAMINKIKSFCSPNKWTQPVRTRVSTNHVAGSMACTRLLVVCPLQWCADVFGVWFLTVPFTVPIEWTDPTAALVASNSFMLILIGKSFAFSRTDDAPAGAKRTEIGRVGWEGGLVRTLPYQSQQNKWIKVEACGRGRMAVV